MKIASYNIWNHDKDYNRRMDLLIEVLQDEDFDIIVLQEVRDEVIVNRIATECNFEYKFWKKYFDCQEGLAILSRYKINSRWTNWDENENEDVHNSGSMYISCIVGDCNLDIMNVHLDYKRASYREIEILKAIDYLGTCDGDYKILLGDFNTGQKSSVYNFLTGQQSLDKRDANWVDLAESYCNRKGLALDATIDFIRNPRWLGKPTLEVPARFDWVLLEEPYPNDNPKLREYKLLGETIVDGITASDHYGIMVEIDFPE